MEKHSEKKRNNTLVTSFVVNVNNNRSIETYLNYGKLLLEADIPKIVFIDEVIFDDLKHYMNETTMIVSIKKSDCYLYEYIDCLDNFNLNTENNKKDTLEYMFIMNNKTEWIRKAIELNHFHTDQFIWVDFGIRHVFKYSGDQTFIKKIETLNEPFYEKIRAPSIWNTNIQYSFNIYKDITWYFAGGVFGGHKDALLQFAEKTKDMCLRVIKEEKTLMWEVNIWYLVFLENPHLFHLYNSDHNSTLVDFY